MSSEEIQKDASERNNLVNSQVFAVINQVIGSDSNSNDITKEKLIKKKHH